MIRVLAELGADVNTPIDDGATPVFIAAQNGHVDAIRVLKELGANVIPLIILKHPYLLRPIRVMPIPFVVQLS